MNKTAVVLASLALLVAGCGDKDEHDTSQMEESGVGEVIEEVDVTTEAADPDDADVMPEATDEETDSPDDAAPAPGM